ncbi:hypothetical protein SBF1_8900003 [Candidatus Desulfosporosinus infrequens]|uniref:Uncharacterized protein n=1 Tax=Candidatus Desulfosporosinus infrequens TaxID=2043169 RepID=A0A2U3LWH8_9FIRM|nr:hypothetical protein SBF1_8900003 [Candidatus Desulfosporosinus infrequens]
MWVITSSYIHSPYAAIINNKYNPVTVKDARVSVGYKMDAVSQKDCRSSI